MGITRNPLGRSIFVTGVFGVIATSVGTGACFVDEIPACPGQCFEYTVEYEYPLPCNNAMGEDYGIPFTGSAPRAIASNFEVFSIA